MTYRDRTYCAAQDCGTPACPRRLTTDVLKQAQAAGLPVSVADFSVGCEDWTDLPEGER